MDEEYEPEDGAEDVEDNRVIKKRKAYPPMVKEAIWNALEASIVDDVYPQGAIADISKRFGVNRRLVENVRDQGMVRAAMGDINFIDQRVNNGRALKYDPVELKARLSALPIESRGTVRDSAHGLDMPWSTFFKYTKTHRVFRSVSIALKPRLTPQHKINRLEFARNKIDASGEYYDPQYNVIHIDEKNFHVDKKTRRVFVGDSEVLPHRTHRNANYIQKVMFLAAVARPVQRLGNVDPDNVQFGLRMLLFLMR
jgi:hypothetical protein